MTVQLFLVPSAEKLALLLLLCKNQGRVKHIYRDKIANIYHLILLAKLHRNSLTAWLYTCWPPPLTSCKFKFRRQKTELLGACFLPGTWHHLNMTCAQNRVQDGSERLSKNHGIKSTQYTQLSSWVSGGMGECQHCYTHCSSHNWVNCVFS